MWHVHRIFLALMCGRKVINKKYNVLASYLPALEHMDMKTMKANKQQLYVGLLLIN